MNKCKSLPCLNRTESNYVKLLAGLIQIYKISSPRSVTVDPTTPTVLTSKFVYELNALCYKMLVISGFDLTWDL